MADRTGISTGIPQEASQEGSLVLLLRTHVTGSSRIDQRRSARIPRCEWPKPGLRQQLCLAIFCRKHQPTVACGDPGTSSTKEHTDHSTRPGPGPSRFASSSSSQSSGIATQATTLYLTSHDHDLTRATTTISTIPASDSTQQRRPTSEQPHPVLVLPRHPLPPKPYQHHHPCPSETAQRPSGASVDIGRPEQIHATRLQPSRSSRHLLAGPHVKRWAGVSGQHAC